jgi:CHAT domain-containing protein
MRWSPGELMLLLLALTLATITPDAGLARAQELFAKGDYRGALSVLEPIAADAAATPQQHARILTQIAGARSQTGPDDRALGDADAAEAAARAIDAYDLLARIESVRGIVWLNRGRTVESLKHLQACLAWAQRSTQAGLIAGAYIRLAAAYQDVGDWTRALDAVNRSAEADPHPSDAARAQYLTRRGLVEVELHEGAAAKTSIGEALALAQRMGDRRTEAQVAIDMALAIERVDRNPQAAAPYAERAVALAREIRLAPVEIPALNQLAALQLAAGDAARAKRTLDDTLAVVARANEHREEPYVLSNLGQALARLGEHEEAARVLRQAAERADADNLARVRWRARLGLAELEAGADPAAADREFSGALAILEEQQTNVLLEGFRAGALTQTLSEVDPYDRYVAFLLERGETGRAFLVSERERARTFLERLSAARDALAAAVPPGYADAENDLLRRISTSQRALRRGDLSDPQRRDAVAAIDRDESQLTALRVHLAAERPSLAHARYPKLWSVDDLRTSVLHDDERLVAYFLGARGSVCWIVGREGLTTLQLPARGEIESRVRAALQELRDPASDSTSAAAALATALQLDRLVAAAGPAPRLVVVPHGILYDVPFEALPAGGRLLVERFAVSYAPSAASLAFFRSLPALPPASRSVVAVGDPVVRSTAPTASTRQVDLEHVDLLAPLPHSRDEALAIAAMFRRARVLNGADATETALHGDDVAGARILHFATHGLIDESRPERSGLVLTASAGDDGLLQAREIYTLPLHAALVTLSACQTALGQHVTGEGIIGLTRAFFYAGARAVIASLWDIEDASTARLMTQFYANIGRGEPIDLALQHAKIAFLRGGGRTARAFYWAPFVATGEARATIDVPSTRAARLWTAALLLAVAGAAILWVSTRRFSGRRSRTAAVPTA